MKFASLALLITAACASGHVGKYITDRHRNEEEKRIIDTISRLHPGKVPARDIIMADFHSKKPKTKAPIVNSFIDDIEDETTKEI